MKGTFYLEPEKLEGKGMEYGEYLVVLLFCFSELMATVIRSLAMCTRCQLLIFEAALSRFDDLTKISKGKGRNVRLEKELT